MSNRIPSTSEQDRLDSLIDRALATYTPANVRPGLEDRVHARIAAEASSAPRQAAHPWRWVWAFTAAVAAAVLLVVMLRPHPRPLPNIPTTARILPEHPVPHPPYLAPQSVSARNTRKPGARPHRSPDTKPTVLERGPSQEQIIAQLLAHAPGAVALMARAQSPAGDAPDKPIEIRPLPDDPIVIAPIEIKPLDDNSAATGGRF